MDFSFTPEQLQIAESVSKACEQFGDDFHRKVSSQLELFAWEGSFGGFHRTSGNRSDFDR